MLWLDKKSILRPTEEKDKEYIDPFENECLWNNGYVMYKGKRLFILDWINANLLYIRDLWYDGDIIPLCEIEDKVEAQPVFLNTTRYVQLLEHGQHGYVLDLPSPLPHQTSRNA